MVERMHSAMNVGRNVRVITKKILSIFGLILSLSLLSFFTTRALPGDPLEESLGKMSAGQTSNTALLEKAKLEKRKALGLDLPHFFWTIKGEGDGSSLSHWIPSLVWNGSKNGYSKWMGDLLWRGGGVSLRDGQTVTSHLGNRFGRSALLVFISVVFSLVLSVPLATYLVKQGHTFPGRLLTSIAFLLNVLPGFLVALLLLLLFANQNALGWFPSKGWPSYAPSTWLGYIPYLALPVLTYTLGLTAFLTRILLSGLKESETSFYALGARARGLSRNQVIKQHALPNAWLPLITVAGGIPPALLAGSIALETTFSIPGMGLEIYEAVLGRDYPVLGVVALLFGVTTAIGFALSDLAYQWADPRVKTQSSSLA